jgi:hypothetical protein
MTLPSGGGAGGDAFYTQGDAWARSQFDLARDPLMTFQGWATLAALAGGAAGRDLHSSTFPSHLSRIHGIESRSTIQHCPFRKSNRPTHRQCDRVAILGSVDPRIRGDQRDMSLRH